MDTPLAYDGPFGSPEYGEYWTDEYLYENGSLNDLEISYKRGKISAIRARYVCTSTQATRKYLLLGHILNVLMHITTYDQL